MSSIKPTEMKFLDQVFERPGEAGYLLDFSNRTFSEFFKDELNVDIDDAAFQQSGTSKMNRFRCFLRSVNDNIAANVLRALWEYRGTLSDRYRRDDLGDAETRFRTLLERLEGKTSVPPAPPEPAPTNAVRLQELRHDLLDLSKLAPHPRGFAFEKFLKSLFDVSGLAGRDSFRLRGEQVDGSFQLGHQTYLLEAKWQNHPVDAGELRGFNGKVEEKTAWSRGLYLSYCGFSDDGLHAFGRGKRIICMDGFDVHETLERNLPLTEVIVRKDRRAVETGNVFVRVRDLFP